MGRNREGLQIQLSYEVDKRATAEVERSAQRAQQAIELLSRGTEEQKQMALDAAQVLQQLYAGALDMAGTDASRAASNIEALTKSLGVSEGQLKDVTEAAENAAATVQQLGGASKSLTETPLFSGRVAAFLDRVGRQAEAELLRAASGALEATEALESIPGALRDTVDAAKGYVEKLSAAIGIGPASLMGVAAIAAAAIAAVVLVLQDMKRAAEEAEAAERTRLEGEADAIRKLYGMDEDARDEHVENARREQAAMSMIYREAEASAIRAARQLADVYDPDLSPLLNTLDAAEAYMIGLQTLHPELTRDQWALVGVYNAALDTAHEYRSEVERLDSEIVTFTSTMADAIVESNKAIRANEGFAESLTEVVEAAHEAAQAARMDIVSGMLERAEEKASKAIDGHADLMERMTDQVEENARRQAEIVGIAERYLEQQEAIQEDYHKRMADLEKRYADRQVELAEQAAEEAEDALEDLREKEADLRRDYARDTADADRKYNERQLQAQISYQADEAKSARDHARRMADIRREGQDREFELLLAGDFRGLYLERRQRSQRLAEENRRYADERQERVIAFRQQQTDRAREFAIERQERAAQFVQRLNDARVEYQQELIDIKAAHYEKLQELREGHAEERAELARSVQDRLNTLRVGAQEELRLAAMTAQQRIAYEKQHAQAMMAIASQLVSGIGAMAAKMPFSAAGLGATMITNNRSMAMSSTFNISGMQGGSLARQIDQRLTTRLNQLMGARKVK